SASRSSSVAPSTVSSRSSNVATTAVSCSLPSLPPLSRRLSIGTSPPRAAECTLRATGRRRAPGRRRGAGPAPPRGRTRTGRAAPRGVGLLEAAGAALPAGGRLRGGKLRLRVRLKRDAGVGEQRVDAPRHVRRALRIALREQDLHDRGERVGRDLLVAELAG